MERYGCESYHKIPEHPLSRVNQSNPSLGQKKNRNTTPGASSSKRTRAEPRNSRMRKCVRVQVALYSNNPVGVISKTRCQDGPRTNAAALIYGRDRPITWALIAISSTQKDTSSCQNRTACSGKLNPSHGAGFRSCWSDPALGFHPSQLVRSLSIEGHGLYFNQQTWAGRAPSTPLGI